MKTLLTHRTEAPAYQPDQKQSVNGRSHLVVPVVMMVEGVHSGSAGPLLHTAQDLTKTVPNWDNIPVTIHHPQDNEGNYISATSEGVVPVGMVKNARMDGEKLKAEAWIDEATLLEVDPALYAHIQAGQPMDVSIGVFTTEEASGGNHKGEAYHAIARNHVPDHLALLPGQQGACSWEDGCGIRVNQKQKKQLKTNANEMTEAEIKQQKAQRIEQLVRLNTNAQGYQEKLMAIQRRLDTGESEAIWHSLEEAYDGYFVYRRIDRNAGTSTYHRQSYQVANDGTVEFVGDTTAVRREVSYVQANNMEQSAENPSMKRTKFNANTNKEGGNMSKNEKPCCLERVVSLISNKRTRFTSADKDWLLEQDAETLERLEPMDIQVNAEQAVEVIKTTYTKPEQFISLMPEAMQEKFQAGLAMYGDHRKGLITNILANAKEVWVEEDLKKLDTNMLERIEKSSRKADYSGQGGFEDQELQINDNGEEPLLPLDAQ